MKPKEPSKCREWEKERRDRLNNSFTALSKLLPDYDPSLTLSKIDILQRAAVYIEQLLKRNNDLHSEGSNTVSEEDRNEINRLGERVKKLLMRNEQLTLLLKDAGIKIPTECGLVKNFNPKLPWSNKISKEKADIIKNKFYQKENDIPKEDSTIAAKKKNKNPINSEKSKEKKKKEHSSNENSNKKVKKRKLKSGMNANGIVILSNKRISFGKNKRIKNRCKSKSSTLKNIKHGAGVLAMVNNGNGSLTVLPATNGMVLPYPQPCYVIANASFTSLNNKSRTVVTQTRSLSTPIVASSIQPSSLSPQTQSSLSSLGPGTLILANGNIMPIGMPTAGAIFKQTPSLITQPTPILVQNPNQANNTTLIVVPTTSTATSTSVNEKENVEKKNASEGIKTNGPSIAPFDPKLPPRPKRKVAIPALGPKYTNALKLHAAKLKDKNVGIEKFEKPKTVKKVDSKKTDDKLITNKIVENMQTKENNADKNVRNDKEHSEKDDNDKEEAQKEIPESNNYSIDALCKETEKLTESSKDITEKLPITDKITSSVQEKQDKNEKAINQAEKETPKEVEAPAAPVPTSTAEVPDVQITTVNEQLLNMDNPASNSAVRVPVPVTTTATMDFITNKTDSLLPHSELSNDIFASLQVPTGSQNPESTSPTAAFLLAFPLVQTYSGVKVSEVMEEDNSDSQQDTPTLLQIGTMESTKPTQSESLTPSLLNLDNFSFFSSKEMNSYYPTYDTNSVGIATTKEEPQKAKDLLNVVPANKSVYDVKPPNQVQEQNKPTHNQYVPKSLPQNYAVDTPQTYQQQKPVNHYQVNYCSCATSTTNTMKPALASNNKTINQKPISLHAFQQENQKKVTKPDQRCVYTCATSTSTTYSFASQCNTFNPFTDFSASFANFSHSSKNYTEPLYTNSSNYNYSYQSEANNFSHSNYVAQQNNKTPTKASKPPQFAASYDTNYVNYKYPENTKTSSSYYCPIAKEAPPKASKVDNNVVRPPVNWMTTPDLRHQSNSDYLVPPFGKDLDFCQNPIFPPNNFSVSNQSYYNSNTSVHTAPDMQSFGSETRKPILDSPFHVLPPNSFQQSTAVPEDNQYSWSPSKIPPLLDSQHNLGLVPSTLPTLIGDLALGISSDKKTEPNQKDSCRSKDGGSASKKMKQSTQYDNQTNFLSVSQLVDHSKSEVRTAARRNSGSRSTKPSVQRQKSRKAESNKEHADDMHKNYRDNEQWTMEKNNQKHYKSTSSNYSAEALIGHQNNAQNQKLANNSSGSGGGGSYASHNFHYSQTNKSLQMPSFMPSVDNIFLPSVDFQSQDNFGHQQNQSYQTNNFGNAVYPSSSYISSTPTITSSYLPSGTLLTDLGNDFINPPLQDNLFGKIPDIKATNQKNASRSEDSNRRNSCSVSTTPKKSSSSSSNVTSNKRKHSHDASSSSFVDLSFLSIPGSINSPILPDDYHTHANFLPPPPPPPNPSQFFPCKNTLYPPKQNADLLPPRHATVQHPETSPIGGSVGSSLTNFNLSTIFPEINKGPASTGLYSSGRTKDYILPKNDSLIGHPISQVPFNNKMAPPRSLSYNANGIPSTSISFSHT